MCWIYTQRGSCPRGNKCNFAHSEAELNQSKLRHPNSSGGNSNNNNNNNNSNSNNRQSIMAQGGHMPSQMGGSGGAGPKDDFFLFDQFGKKPIGHLPSGETSPMRYPASSSGGGGASMGHMTKAGSLPPQQQQQPPSSNNLLLPQPYNNDMMMPMGPGPGGGPPPTHLSAMNHPGHLHPVSVHHHQGHSPLHAPYSSGAPPPPPQSTSLHPYHGSNPGNHFNAMGPPTPNQLSPIGKFGYDPTKFNPNIRASPNQQGQPPPPPVMTHPGRSPRNFPKHPGSMGQLPPPPPPGKGGGGGGYNPNMFMNEMLGAQQNQMGLVPPSSSSHSAQNASLNKAPNVATPTPNMNVCNEFGNKNDYLNVQQQQQQHGKSNGGASSYYWRKPPNSPGGGGQQQHSQNMMKSPSHLVGQMNKAPPMGNKNYSGLPNAALLNDMLSPRQPIKNSPTFFGKDEMNYWNMGPSHGHVQQQPPPQQQQQQQVNVDPLQRDVVRGVMLGGPGTSGHSAVVGQHMSHLYGEALSSTARRMFDRSDSILTGEDAPFEGNATTSKFGPISRKASNSLGTGDTLKSSLSGLDLRHQACLNNIQASSSQSSPRLPLHRLEKQLSPSKEMGLGITSTPHLTVRD